LEQSRGVELGVVEEKLEKLECSWSAIRVEWEMAEIRWQTSCKLQLGCRRDGKAKDQQVRSLVEDFGGVQWWTVVDLEMR